MEQVIVRYKIKPANVAENEQYIRLVFEELQQLATPGFTYAVYKLDDGHSFFHIAVNSGDQQNPLPGLNSFKNFRAAIKERCDQQPIVTHVTQIGFYNAAVRLDYAGA